MADKSAKRKVYIYIDGSQVANSVDAISKELRKVQAEQKKMVIGSDEYIRSGRKITQLNSILKEHSASINHAGKSWLSLNKVTDGFNRFFGIVTSVIAAITGITFATRKSVDEFAALEEKEADVRKYTGMTRDQVKQLNEEFKKMDTRTSREQLNSLAADAGRLGIKGKKDILEFVQAANIINVSLGEDLGKDAIKNIGKLAQMFGVEGQTLKEGMLSVGSAINEVAQNSAAAEPYLVDFAARLSGTAKQAGISVSDILGFASVLDQDMQQVEMSATALQNLIMKVYQEPAKFAKMAGKDVKEFTNILKKDANEAILQLLGNLRNAGGLDKLAPIFKEMGLDGVRASGVLNTLAANLDKIRKEQETANKAYQDGSSAINEYNVKNNTLQASFDKAKKKFKELSYELGEKLSPYMSNFISLGGSLVKVLSALTGFVIKHSGALTSLAIVAGSYFVILKSINIFQAAYNSLIKVGTTLKILHAVAVANLSGNLTGANKILLLFNGSLSRNSLVVKACTALTYLYAAAKALLTGNIAKATIAFKTFNTVLKNSPSGIVIGALSVLAGVIYGVVSATKKAKSATVDYYSAVMKERNELNKVYNQLLLTNEKTDQRTRLINEFNSNFGKYLTNLLDEKSTIKDIKKAYREATAAMNDHYAQEIYASKQSEIVKENIEEQSSTLKKSVDLAIRATKEQKVRLAELINDVTNGVITDNPDYGIGNVRQEIYGQINREFGTGASYDLFGGSSGWESFSKTIFPYIQGVQKTISRLNNLKDELSPFMKELKELKEEPDNFESLIDKQEKLLAEAKKLPESTKKESDEKKHKIQLIETEIKRLKELEEAKRDISGENDDPKDLQDKIKKYEDEAAVYKAGITAMYAIGKMTRKEHDDFIEDADRKLLSNKMTLYSKKSSEYNDLLIKRLNMEIKAQEVCTKETIAEIEEGIEKEKRLLFDKYIDQTLSKKDYDEGILRLDRDALVRKQAQYASDSDEFRDFQRRIDEFDAKDKEKRYIEYENRLAEFQKEYQKKTLWELHKEELDKLDELLKAKVIKIEFYEKLKAAILKKYSKSSEKSSGSDFGNDSSQNPEKKTPRKRKSYKEQQADDLKDLEKDYILDFYKLNKQYVNGQILYEDYEEGLLDLERKKNESKDQIDKEYKEKRLNREQIFYSGLSSIVSAYLQFIDASQELEIAKVNQKYDSQIKAAGESSNKVKQLEEKKEKEIAAIKTKYANRAFAIQLAMAIASTATAAINAYASAAEIPFIGGLTLGPVAAAMAVSAGMIQIATITKQHQAAKKGYFRGGYTPSGAWDEEQGVVHSDEFVANRFATANSSIRPVFDVIDYAQRTGTVANLTREDIAHALSVPGYYNGGYTPRSNENSSASTTASSNDNMLLFMGIIEQNTRVMERMHAKLSIPLEVINTVDGEHGMKRAFDEYNKLINNKSRL